MNHIWRLLYHSRPHGLTVDELAARLRVDRRTIYGDIKLISEEWKIALAAGAIGASRRTSCRL